MQKAVSVVSLLFLGSTWTLQVADALPESFNFTQENFDFDQFMGKWYEVAVASTCPHYLQRKKQHPVTAALQLNHETSESNFTMTTSTVWKTSCKETSTVYSLTDTPGRFFHHVARFGADVDTIVVRTNYDEFATMFQLSTEKPSGNKTIIVKLYSRTEDTSPAVLGEFKALIRQHGMDETALIVNEYKGECIRGKQVTESSTQPQAVASVKPDRSEASPLVSAQVKHRGA